MRRILLVLTVAAVMATMMIATAVPAFAARGSGQSANGCGLTEQSDVATEDGRRLGENVSGSARASGSFFGLGNARGASGCSHNG
jgi:hypothetical protein